ncbi:MAG: DapH/DapD/GlmU-related protein [Candidatus Thermoplasmatota archaeon]|nr:DapH/DapD/GlmU-related protein [Candidatus Thermoplasmatota archaeon]
MAYSGEENKIGGITGTLRAILLFAITTIAYALGILPLLILAHVFLQWIDIGNPLGLVLLSIFIVAEYLVLLFSMIFSTAFFINVFKLKYSDGTYRKTLNDKMAFKFVTYFALYYPTYKLINIFVLPQLKSFYLSLIGCKIGKNVFLAGEEWIDPCMVEIGENTMIGGRAMILGHIAEENLLLRRTKIGKNCLIGGGSFIMPGVVIEDNVVVGAKAMVPKDMVLKSGKTYVGIPAKPIK